jgi:hypothetical protein
MKRTQSIFVTIPSLAACAALAACAVSVANPDDTGMDPDAGHAADAASDARHDAHAALKDAAMTGMDAGDQPDTFVAPVDANMSPRDANVPPRDANMPPVDAALGCVPVINELQAASATATGDEWIELYNPCTTAINLNGWKIDYRSAANNNGGTLVTLTQSIPVGGYLLFVGPMYTGSATKDGTLSNGIAQSGGAVGLLTPNDVRADSVSFDMLTTVNDFTEGTPAKNPPKGQSIGRHPDGTDTENNNSDFQVYTTPTPRMANP